MYRWCVAESWRIVSSQDLPSSPDYHGRFSGSCHHFNLSLGRLVAGVWRCSESHHGRSCPPTSPRVVSDHGEEGRVGWSRQGNQRNTEISNHFFLQYSEAVLRSLKPDEARSRDTTQWLPSRVAHRGTRKQEPRRHECRGTLILELTIRIVARLGDMEERWVCSDTVSART